MEQIKRLFVLLSVGIIFTNNSIASVLKGNFTIESNKETTFYYLEISQNKKKNFIVKVSQKNKSCEGKIRDLKAPRQTKSSTGVIDLDLSHCNFKNGPKISILTVKYYFDKNGTIISAARATNPTSSFKVSLNLKMDK